MRVFLIPSRRQVSWNRWDSNWVPWSECRKVGIPYFVKNPVTRASATVTASMLGRGNASRNLVKQSIATSASGCLREWANNVNGHTFHGGSNMISSEGGALFLEGVLVPGTGVTRGYGELYISPHAGP